MLFSIIIPTYNYGQYLERALYSILQQSFQAYEIIVVDDGSTDDTPQIMRAFTTQFLHIQYINQQRQGPGKARNLGAKHAKGDWLIFLDADDYFAKNALSVFQQAISCHTSAEVILAAHYKEHPDKPHKFKKPLPISTSTEKNFIAFIQGKLNLFQGTFTIRQDIFHKLNGYPENIFHSEDCVLWGRLIANCCLISITTPVMYICTHPKRLRNDYRTKEKEALRYVDLLFDSHYLPPQYLKYKKNALARGLLALAHTAYQTHRYAAALSYYHQAAKYSVMDIIHARQIKRYFIAHLKKFLKIM